MKAFKILTLFFICLITHLTKLYAQKDYIITKNKDTVSCEIKTDSYGEYKMAYKYRINKVDDFIRIDTNNIVAYFLAKDSSTYLLKPVPGQNQRGYVKRFVKGRINLYAYTSVYQFINGVNNIFLVKRTYPTFLYANKDMDGLVQIKHASGGILSSVHIETDEKQAFINLISDDPGLAEKFKNVRYDFIYILNYVKMYNTDYLNNNKPAK